MRHPLFLPAVVTVASVLAPLARGAEPAAPSGPFERACALYKEGKHAEALAIVEAHRKTVPPSSRLSRWTIDFQGRAVPVVLVGKRHLYYATTGYRNEHPPLGVRDDRPSLNDSKTEYGFQTVITCTDAATGDKLWSRRAEGHFDLAIDPRNDNLYVWREKLFRLRPRDGEVDQTRQLPGRPNRVEALFIAGRPYVPRPQDNLPNDEPGRQLQTCNVDNGGVARRDVVLPLRLSPDESRVLSITIGYAHGLDTVIAVRPLKADGKTWKYEHGDYSYNEPLWLGDDVVALNGIPTGKAEVVRLNGANGEVKWSFKLPRGAYASGYDMLPGNTCPPRTWSAVGMCGEHLLALGGEGSLYFLDPATGGLVAKASPVTSHLAFPRLVDGALVVSSIQGIRSIPLDVALGRARHTEQDVALLQARCLDALGRTAQAQARLGEVLEQDPDFRMGWAVQADLCRKKGRAFEEIAARCRYLELTGTAGSPELRERWGLVRRIATHNDICADLKRLGDTIYAGTCGGWLYAIDARTLEVVEKKEHRAAFLRLPETSRLKASLADRREHDLAGHSEDDIPGGPNGPPAWQKVSGLDGSAVRWRGRYYRPLAGGHVRVLDGENVTEHKTSLKGIRQWQIHLSPAGPLGYGGDGVHVLDEHLCPVRDLISELKGEPVALLASTGRTLAVLVSGAMPRLQVWTRDGKRKLREQAVLPPRYRLSSTDRLVPLCDGYLLSGGELTWVPASPDGRVWRFGFGDEPGRSLPKLPRAPTALFGRPLLLDNLLFVTCRDGGIYAFDVGAITRPARP